MNNFLFAMLSIALLVPGCATTPTVTLTPLEIQSLQTREYEPAKDVVFASVVSVFQDLGYAVKSADLATGLITAEGTAKSDAASKFWLGVSKVSQTSATAFIEQIGEITKVRLSFVTKKESSGWYGQTDRTDTPVLDGEVYKNAFNRIEDAIFIRAK